MNTLASAIRLHAEGFCLLPLLPSGKRPARRWKRLQTERPTADELVEWFARDDYEIGIVTGAISGITVIDCDSLDCGPRPRGYVRAYPDAAAWTRAAVEAAPLVPEAAREGGRQPEGRERGKSESVGECYIWDEAREAWRWDFEGHSLWFARETMEFVGSE